MKRVHIFYKGRVQGVGFRYNVHRIASEWNTSHGSPEQRLTGWVRNLRDGRVELVAESTEESLQAFLENIKREFGSNIQDIESERGDGTGEFVDFTIAPTN